MLRVFLTVDTEVWPMASDWPHTPLPKGKDCSREIDAYFEGGAADGPGIDYVLSVLARHGLSATFFVEPLFSHVLGLPVLASLVTRIRLANQEIGLHLHPEWLSDLDGGDFPAFCGPCLWHYDPDAQDRLIAAGSARLAEAGAAEILCFRAGGYAADLSTLPALRRHGILFDSSLNPCYEESFPSLADKARHVQPARFEEVWEIPVSNLVDRPPAGRRHMQVAACSLDEFRIALEGAEHSGWQTFVIVLHSFEFVRVDRLGKPGEIGRQRLLMRRFEQLCAFLGAHRNRFVTSHFGTLDPKTLSETVAGKPVQSTRVRTALRMVEQALSRVY